MRYAFAVVLSGLVLAVPAAAGERLIATYDGRASSSELRAAGGWIAWWREPFHQVLWHAGERTQAEAPQYEALGTDARGRAVGLRVDCVSPDHCGVYERLLPDGPLVKRIAVADDAQSVDAHHGSYLVSFGGHGHPRGVFLQERGKGRLHKLSSERRGRVSISRRAMMTAEVWNNQFTLYGAGRDHPHDWRRLVQAYRRDDGRRSHYISDPQADGRFVYWIDRSSVFEPGWQFRPGSYREEVVRIDVTAAHPRAQKLRLPRSVGYLAVDGGRLYYTHVGRDSYVHVYELTDPEF